MGRGSAAAILFMAAGPLTCAGELKGAAVCAVPRGKQEGEEG